MPKIASNIVDCYPFRRTSQDLEFLMLQRASDRYLGDTWHAVSGHIEAGETAQAAAIRELREEAGLEPLRLWQLQFVNTFFIAKLDTIMMCPGFAAEVDARAQVRLSVEHQAYRWVPQADAELSFLWAGQRQAVLEVVETILENAPAARYTLLD